VKPAPRYDALTSADVAGAAGVTLLPVGATEQHGPHLPLGTDWWLAEAVAAGAARLAPGTDVAAALPYGVSPHHLGFPGTVTLRPRTFIDLLTDVCRSLADQGRLPLVVNGHGGNRGAIEVAIAELGASGRTAWALSYFELLDDVVAEEFPDGHRHVGHACALETSLVTHLWPETVATDQIPAGTTPPAWPDPHLYGTDHVTTWRPFEAVNPTGVVGTPSLANAAAGRRLYETATRRVADAAARIRGEAT
jgi:creatinine amidohydrolase